MRSGRKPYENKRDVDPGRLRHVIQFSEQNTTDDGYGGTTVTDVVVLTTKAAKEKVNMSSRDAQLALQAGVSEFVKLQNFIIRNRAGFYPTKDMTATVDGDKWTILGVTELDDPEKFTRLLCGLRV